MSRSGTSKRSGYILVAIFAAAFSFPGTAYSQSKEKTIIDSYISKQAAKAGAEEYEEARKVVKADINADGKTDLIVLYSLEGFGGGNNYVQYLAVFLGKANSFQHAAGTAVGGKMHRDVDLRSVTGSTIYLDTKEYRKNDAACCPSRPAKARYAFSKGKLLEIK